MSKGFRWRLFLSLLAIGGSIYIVATTTPRLGLDLQGGTQIVFEAEDTDEVTVDADVISRTVEVLRRRVDAVGVTEPTIQASGDRRIIVELPGISDPDAAIEVIGRTAQLTFHPVVAAPAPGEEPEDLGENTLLLDEDGFPLVVGPAALIGEEVETAIPFFDSFGQWTVQVQFRGSGSDAWADLTADAACQPLGSPGRRIAIVLDETVISSPQVSSDVGCDIGIVGGQTVITGQFDQETSGELALLIRAGALPVPVTIIEQGTIGPTLGDAAIEASVNAALIGAALTILYMIIYYRLLGVVAAISLVAYALITSGVLLWMGATITLPGIAGFVLAIGMAVDANVLIYERTKEEYQAGAGIRDAASAGFTRAWSAIADSNVTTLLAAIILFFFAAGAVRGFGITLSIGVIVSMFTALVVTRVLVDLLTRIERLSPGVLGLEVGRGLKEWIARRNPQLFRRIGVLFAVAAVVVIVSITGMVSRGFDFGLEFSGGRLMEFQTTVAPDLDEVRTELATVGFPRAVVQSSGQGHLIIRTEQLSEEEEVAIVAVVEELGGSSTLVRDQFVGPTLGVELRNKALIALGLALAVQLVYLAIRFRWTMGVAAVTAMFHDVAILVGLFAWLGKTIDGVFLAALLTVIGYSINDSVVIFDRIRERRKLEPDAAVADVANEACLQTIPRTINTGLGAIFILVALWILGGDTLADFALALLIGVLVGTYSSVFVSTPIYVGLERRYPAPIPEPEPPPKTKTGATRRWDAAREQ